MRWLLGVLLILVTAPETVSAKGLRRTDTAYAAGASRIWSEDGGSGPPLDDLGGMLSLDAPDGRSRVAGTFFPERREYIRLTTTGRIGRHALWIDGSPNSELMWSPDSRMFFVTRNDGGSVAGYDLTVAGRFAGRFAARDLSRLVRKAYGPAPCDRPEPVNVAGVGWLPNGHLLAAAEVPGHSSCDYMGTFKVFEVDPQRRLVVRAWRQVEAKRRFSRMLGPRLAGADDGCARDPRSCLRPEGTRGGTPLPKSLPKL